MCFFFTINTWWGYQWLFGKFKKHLLYPTFSSQDWIPAKKVILFKLSGKHVFWRWNRIIPPFEILQYWTWVIFVSILDIFEWKLRHRSRRASTEAGLKEKRPGRFFLPNHSLGVFPMQKTEIYSSEKKPTTLYIKVRCIFTYICVRIYTYIKTYTYFRTYTVMYMHTY